MAKPQRGTVKALRMWFDGKAGLFHAPTFRGLQASRLKDADDLVALCPERENDLLSRIVEIPYFRLLCLGAPVDESLNFYSKRKIKRAVAILSMIILAALLIGSIVALYLVTNTHTKLGLICLFTVLFALSIHISTDARRGELFAATAAWVYVSWIEIEADQEKICSSPSRLREWKPWIEPLLTLQCGRMKQAGTSPGSRLSIQRCIQVFPHTKSAKPNQAFDTNGAQPIHFPSSNSFNTHLANRPLSSHSPSLPFLSPT